MKIDSI